MKNKKSLLKLLLIVLMLTLTVIASSITVFATTEVSTSDSYSKNLSSGWEKDTVTASYQFIGSGGSDRKG